jgi:membrane-bound lytic murein transglycosylase MltF
MQRSRPAAALILAFVASSAACTETQKSVDSAPPVQAAPAGAGDAGAAPPTPAAEEDAPSNEAIARVLAPWTGDLDGMLKRGHLRMLVAFSKTNYFLDKAQQRGLTYDAGQLLEAFLNERLKTKTVKLHVVYIPVSRDRIFDELARGRGDLAAAGLTITPDRQAVVDFAPPFLSNVREVVVTAADQPAVAHAEDLSGRTVHVRRSSSYFTSLAGLNRQLGASGRPPVTVVEAPEALEDEDLLEMVNAGLIPATIVNDHVAAFWTDVFDNLRVQPAHVRADGQIAWAIRKGTPQLREAVDTFVRANAQGSRHFNILYQRYLKNTAYVKNAATESEMRKFRQVRSLFERFGGQYDLPWLLLAAQGYQESQLDQRRQSPVGAVGVMQIKPSTAAGSPINITGVDASVEKNIQAGAKYLRFIVDQYYADEPMERIDKGLFAVASYNAGPARIAQLRRKAAALGLDENRWFGNVEVVAAREIGRETVTYVSNIYKYYVSYNLLMQEAQERQRVRGR